MESEFSESQNACFIVQDSQGESEYSQLTTSKMLLTLSALRQTQKSSPKKNEVLYSPRKCDMPVSQDKNRMKRTAAGSQNSQDDNPQPQGGDQDEQGNNGGQGHAGGGGDDDGGGGDGGGGGGNGDDGGDDDDDEEEQGGDAGDAEQHAEEGTPTNSEESGGSIPPLVAVEVGEQNVPLGVPEHLAPQHHEIVNEEESDVPAAPQGQAPISSADSVGGISDAPTAVISSDTDVQGSHHTSPGHMSLDSPRQPLNDISTTHSTLSSFTSSSSDPPTTQQKVLRKRLLPRRLNPQTKRQKGLDISVTSSDTSGRDTTSSSKKDTTTTSDTSHDTTRDRSHGGADQFHDQFGPGSQEDLFDDEDKGDIHPPQDTSGAGPSGANVAKLDVLFATPAEKLSSLHFSGQATFAAESVAEEGSPDEVPPSQDVFENCTPKIIPGTPSQEELEGNLSQFENAEEVCNVKAKSSSTTSSSAAVGGMIRTKSFQEWQPSLQSYDSSSRSRPTSSVDKRNNGSSLDKKNGSEGQEAILQISATMESDKSKRRRNMAEPVESQLDVEITSVETSKNIKGVSEADSMALNLQLGATEQSSVPPCDETKITIDLSGNESLGDVILVEPEKTIIKIDSCSSKSEEQKQSNEEEITLLDDCEQNKDPEENSQELALHLSQSQTQHFGNIGKGQTTPLITPPKKTSSQRVGTSQAFTQGEGKFHLSLPKEGSLLHPTVALSPLDPKKAKQTNDESDHAEVHVSPAPPSLTLDMIDTMPEEDSVNTEATTAFTLYRPSILEVSTVEESERVLSKPTVKQVLMKKLSSESSKNSDPYEYSEGKDLREQVAFTSQVKEKESRKEKLKEMLREQQTQEDCGVRTRKSNIAEKQQSSEESIYDKDTEVEDMDVTVDPSVIVVDKDKLKYMLGQATMEYEDEEDDSEVLPEEVDYTQIKGKRKNKSSQNKKGALSSPATVKSQNLMDRDKYVISPEKRKDIYEKFTKSKQIGEDSKQATEVFSDKGNVMTTNNEENTNNMPSIQQKKLKENTSVATLGDSITKPEKDHKILHYMCETPRSHHKRTVSKLNRNSEPVTRVSDLVESERHVISDPYEYTLSQSQRDRQSKEVALQLQDRARAKAEAQMKPEASVTKPTQTTSSTSNKESFVLPKSKTNTKRKTRPGSTITLRRSDTIDPERNTSIGNSGGRGISKKDSSTIDRTKLEQQTSCSSCRERTFHTIKIRTITSQIMEIVEEREGGKVVSTRVVSEKSETLSRDITRDEESWSTPSPSRTVQSLTPGDMGDLSSFSGSGPPSKHGSTFGSSRTSLPSSSHLSGSSGRLSLSLNNKSLNKNVQGSLTSTVEECAIASSDAVNTRVSLGVNRQVSTEGTTSDTVPVSEIAILPSLQSAQQPPAPKTTESSDSKRTSDEHGLGSEFSCAELKAVKESLIKTQSKTCLLTKQSTGNVGQSEDLFSTMDESEPHAVTKKPSLTKPKSRSSSSAKYSDSLFSTAGSEVEPQDNGVNLGDPLFAKPLNVPSATSRQSHSDNDRRSTDKAGSSETEVVPPTDTEMSYPYKRNLTYINTSMVEASSKHSTSTTGTEHEDDISPEIPVVSETSKTYAPEESQSSSGSSHRDIICVPPYRPTEIVEIGTAVLGMWKDKHYYPGHVVGHDKFRSKDVYQILFDDETQGTVKPTDIIVCELLAIGQKCLAETKDGWSEVCTVIEHHMKKDIKSCIVQFEDGRTEKIERKQLSINKEQFKELVTATVACFKPTVKDTETECTDPKGKSKRIEGNKKSKVPQDRSNLDSKEATGSEVSTTTGSNKKSHRRSTMKNKSGKSSQSCATPLKKEEHHQGDMDQLEDCVPFAAYLPPVGTVLSPYTAVFAMWRDKHYYPGYIQKQDAKNGRSYIIRFEDGDERSVKTDDIFVCDLLKQKLGVLAERDNDLFESAIVLGHWKCGEKIGYTVEFDDHTKLKLERGKVILTDNQANTLIDEDIKPFTTPKPRAGDVTLENLVEGKRVRVLKSETKDSPNKGTASQASRSSCKSEGRVTSQQSASPYASNLSIQTTGDKRAMKRKRGKIIEPRFHSTPTPKRRHIEPEEQELGAPSPVGELLDSPIQQRKSPRGARHELFSHIKGLIPIPGSTIFKGMIFLLSHVDKSEEEQRKDQEAIKILESVSTTDDSAVEDEPVVPYDKEHLIQQIECGGGQVIQNVDASVITRSSHCYLVSDTYQRTLKYLTCLALAKPCVSHVWIKDSCTTGQLQDYKSYLLPAGLSIESNKLVELPNQPSPLYHMTLMISSKNPRFCKTWRETLEIAGARLCDKLLSKSSQRDRVTAVIADKYIDESIVLEAEKSNIPVLSSEWIVQSLINGKVMSYSGHPRYRYNYDKDTDN